MLELELLSLLVAEVFIYFFSHSFVQLIYYFLLGFTNLLSKFSIFLEHKNDSLLKPYEDLIRGAYIGAYPEIF
jgi:nitrate reductase gamma subunit